MLNINVSKILNIKDSPEFSRLLHDYVEESSMVSYKPNVQWDIYQSLEDAGVLHCITSSKEDVLTGFVLFITSIMPHYGVKMASVESYFVDKEHRESGAGLALLRMAEEVAKSNGAVGFLSSAPVNSRLCRILPRVGYRETNRVFYKDL